MPNVTNMTKGLSYAVWNFGAAYRENLDGVMTALRELEAHLQSAPMFGTNILESLDMAGVDEFGDSAVSYP